VLVTGRSTVVELVGLAGAGKTTLARELVTSDPSVRLDLPPSRARSALAQAAGVAPFVLPHLRGSRGGGWFTRDQVRGLGYLRTWRAALGRVGPEPRLLLLDHGPLFRLAQLDAFGPPVAETAAFRRWWEARVEEWAGRLDLVVWLDAPEELLVRRIRGRDQKHVLRTADDDASLEFLARYRASYERVLARVREISPGAVLTLRTDTAAPPALAVEVRRRLVHEAHLDA
jgi:shikimate kinase